MGAQGRTNSRTPEDAGLAPGDGGSATDSRTSKEPNVEAVVPGSAVIATGPGIDPTTEREARRRATQFRKAYLRTVREAWHLGEVLRKAKGQVRHGQWIPWLHEIGLPPRTAQRFMELYDRDPQMRHVAHLGSITGALRALPAARTPETAGGASSSGRPAGEVQPASADVDGTSLGDASDKTAGARPPARTATAARRGDTLAAAAGDVATVVEHLEQVLSATSPRTADGRLSDLRGLFKLIQVSAAASVRRLAGWTDDEQKAAEVAGKFVAALEDVTARIGEHCPATPAESVSRVDQG